MKKDKSIDKDDLCYVEEVEENGLVDFVPGNLLAQFTFENESTLSNEPMLKTQLAQAPLEVLLSSGSHMELLDNRTRKSEPNDITPPIDGEYFVTKRGFTFRKSTVRKLNELKAAHPNENVYLSTIVDRALRHYHKYIFEEKGSQD